MSLRKSCMFSSVDNWLRIGINYLGKTWGKVGDTTLIKLLNSGAMIWRLSKLGIKAQVLNHLSRIYTQLLPRFFKLLATISVGLFHSTNYHHHVLNLRRI